MSDLVSFDFAVFTRGSLHVALLFEGDNTVYVSVLLCKNNCILCLFVHTNVEICSLLLPSDQEV